MRLRRHRRALLVLGCALVLDAAGGVAFAVVEHLSVGIGLYWATATATTTGYGDVTPHTSAGHVVAELVMLTVIPLWMATFSLLTSGLTSEHIEAEGARARTRLDHIIRHHPDIPAMRTEEER